MHTGSKQFVTRIQQTILATLITSAWFATPSAAQGIPVNDDTVQSAIDRGVAFIKAARNSAGHWEPEDRENQASSFTSYGGDSALALLALLYAGENSRSEEMTRSLDWLANQELSETYTVGVRAHVFALTPGDRYRRVLRRDIDWLVRSAEPTGETHAGGYSYLGSQARGGGEVDNSNSQYAVLGVWMASDVGLDVPDAYWEVVGQYWLTQQNSDGGWGYKPGSSRSSGSMTAAGLATLYVVLDRYFTARPRALGPALSAIEAGVDWFGNHFDTENPQGADKWRYYYLYGVERIGRASGYKYFRDVDWFQVGSEFLLNAQQENGAWPGSQSDGVFSMTELRNTAFAMMFLCHGRAPLVFNKLRYIPPALRDRRAPRFSEAELKEMDRDERKAIVEELEARHDWNQKSRDVAGLVRHAENSLERLLNWQIVDVEDDISDWMEAPVLYLTGERAWEFSSADVEKLREYVGRGGLLFAVAHDDSRDFIESMRALASKLFPNESLERLEKDHPLLNGEVRMPIEDPPPLYAVSDGRRMLMLVSGRDIAEPWHYYRPRRYDDEFALGINLYLYATDKTTPRSRLARRTIETASVVPLRTVRVARIKYGGLWNPEPYGWPRFGQYMLNESQTKVLVEEGITFDDPRLADFSVAHITGDAAFDLTDAERRGLRTFLTGGGTLLADALDGADAFVAALEQEVQAVLRQQPQRVARDAPLVTGEGILSATPLADLDYRRAARRFARGRGGPPLRAFEFGRRKVVIYSPLDISTGLLGTQVYDNVGYAEESALRVLRNMLLYAQLSTLEKVKLGQ